MKIINLVIIICIFNGCNSPNNTDAVMQCSDGNYYDLDDDNLNCGSCGIHCTFGATCQNGSCRITCNGLSVDNNSDTNCGHCDWFCQDTHCFNGACVGDQACVGVSCPTGQRCIGGICTTN